MGKNVLIVGASGDIGMAIAKHRLQKGDQLILHYHSNKDAISELMELTAENQIIGVIQADLSTKEGIDVFLSKLVFHVDTVIFANGKTEFGLFQDATSENMEEMLLLHVQAPWMITKYCLSSMVKEQAGKIIFITSIWGDVGASFEVLYSSVKGAQNSFVKALAKEVAQSNISVLGISPGFIDTKMNQDIDEDERQEILETIPLQRPGYPEEVADAVNFLLDTETSYLNGQIIPVTGGWML